MSMKKRLFSMALAASMVASSFVMPAMADTEAGAVDLSSIYARVTVSSQIAGAYALAPEPMYVAGNKAESYGYTDAVTDGVSTLDVMVAETEKMFGDEYTAETKDDYLAVGASGWVTTAFATVTYDYSFLVNDKMPTDGTVSSYGGYNGLLINQAKVADGDTVKFLLYEDTAAYMDSCVTFKDASAARIKPGESVDVEVQGYTACYYGCYEEQIKDHTAAVEDASFGLLEADGTVTPIEGVASDENGKASIKFDTAGVYTLVAYGYDAAESPLIMATKDVVVQPEYQDGTYTVTANLKMADWKAYYSYPKADYSVDITVAVKDGKVADLFYTQDCRQMKMAFDRNYMVWAMEGHKVTNPNYSITKYISKNTYAYPINEKGLAEQVVENNGTYGCDTVTAATITSDVVLKAVDEALVKAAAGEKDATETLRPAEDTTDAIVADTGVYVASVDCDSATVNQGMAVLFSKDGKMTMQIALEQRPTTYPLLYAGTEKEAMAAGEDAWQSPYADYDYGYKYPGSLYVNVPVKSLDKILPFVMFASGSGNWFNRQMVVASEDLYKIEEGVYTADEFTAEGGTGKVTFTCNNILVKDGQILAEITATSAKLTQVVVNGETYVPEVDSKKGTATFTIPVVLNSTTKATVTTVAMSAPHDIDYTFTIKVNDFENLTPGVKGASTIELADVTTTYSGKAKKVTVASQTGSAADAVIKYYSDKECTTEIEAPVNAGTYYAKATVAADGFCEAAESNVATLTINKKSSTITLTAKSANYTGKTISIAKAKVTGSTGKVTYTYYSDKACTKKVTSHVNAGTYYVKATVAADANYKSATSKAVTLTIKTIAPTIKVKVSSKTYKASDLKKASKSFTIGATVNSKGKITYSSSSSKVTVSTSGKVTVKKGTGKGKYTVKVKAAAKGNYKSGTKTVTITVK